MSRVYFHNNRIKLKAHREIHFSPLFIQRERALLFVYARSIKHPDPEKNRDLEKLSLDPSNLKKPD